MASSPQKPPTPGGNFRNLSGKQTFLIGLAIFTLLVLMVAIYLATSASTPTIPLRNTNTSTAHPSSTPTSTLIPSITPTIMTSPRPSFTPKPTTTPTTTPTATLTPTRTLIPSLTPAVPSIYNDIYHLVNWTPELASWLIQLLEAYPNSLSTYARGEDNSGFYAAFEYAILAQREALLRFPDADQANEWLYGLAYNYARTGNPNAGSIYTNLITNELDEKHIRVDELSSWGSQLNPPLTIERYPLATLPGQLSNNLVKLTINDHGSAYFWLIEKPNSFESYSLTSDFDFSNSIGVNFFIGDVTNDGVDDAVIFRSPLPDSLQPPLPRIFNLAFQPPIELYIMPEHVPDVAPGFHNNWEPNSGDLQFTDTVFPPCPVMVQHTYTWNGNQFEFTDAGYQIESTPTLLGYCNLVIDYSIQAWDLRTTVQLMETLLPSWPPQTTPQGTPYPPDALDEWRYRLGLYHAILGDSDQTREYLNSLVNNPTSPSSEWITPSLEFLKAYQNQRDIYKSCLPLPYCDPDLALKSLVSTFSEEDYTSAIELLESAGLTIRSSGFFDFNGDGSSERWIIIRHQPSDKSEFWILDNSNIAVKATFVDYTENNHPRVTYVEPMQDPPIVKIDQGTTFIYEGTIDNQEPYIQFVTPKVTYAIDLTKQKLSESEEGLLTGVDPSQIKTNLLTLEGSPSFTCDYITCPHFLYLLGLSNELSGDEPDAVNAYVDLWREYPRNPYTIIARIKLQGLILPPTLTPTPKPTQTPSPTLPSSGTSSPPTPTPSGTQLTATTTVTPSPTLTLTAYPYP